MNETPLVDEFVATLNKSLFPFLAEAVNSLSARPGYRNEFETVLHLIQDAFPERPWPKWAANGLLRFNRVVLQEERGFRETGNYRKGQHEFEEVKAEVYDAADVMEGYYLVGLLLTYYTWPHHYEILQFYRDSFLAKKGAATRIMEWGVGHGLYTLLAAREWPKPEITAVDVSEFSLEFSRRLLAVGVKDRRTDFVLGDVLDPSLKLPRADRLICSELLEHVPDPQGVIRRIEATLLPGGCAYLTAAINAAQPDHIYLFDSASAVQAMVVEAGLTVDSLISLRHPKHHDNPDAPTVVALVASKAPA